MEIVTLTITINGQTIKAPFGSTILQAARQAGIDIPTLCNHPALVPVGACRVCLVEVKGQRNLQPACTFPVVDGMEVQTETPALVKARKFVIDMLFSQRNHFCMFCEMSGKCELQDLGYRYGIDHWIYSTYTKRFPVDATSPYFLLDHNRCVLCSRCLRACDELPVNRTLGLGQRGADSMICADGIAPLGSSTCISCGSCVQVCPTGALFEKHSAFMGTDEKMSCTKSICSFCSIGCGMTIVTRGDQVQRIESDWEAPVNGGRLCRKGRFEPLYDGRKRLTTPLVRRNGKLAEADWDEALQIASEHIGRTDAAALGALSSGDATNEALYLFQRLFRRELGAAGAGLLRGGISRLTGMKPGKLSDLENSDLILLIGADPTKDQPVASFLIKRALDKGAKLVIVDDRENSLSPFAWQTVPSGDLDKLLVMAVQASRPVVLHGAEMTADAAKSLMQLGKKAVAIALEPAGNGCAARALGFQNGLPSGTHRLLYILLGEEKDIGENLQQAIAPDAFLIVQASYTSPLAEKAHVLLPSAIWSERDGTLTNTEGRVQRARKAREPLGESRQDWEILALLADRLGRKMGESFDDISAQTVREVQGKEI
ncbi:MAG: molybdopterin-dependent oxidoreductase [Syntrophaceae bacterium]|nr:molybdopterin-dependent oxidoreductase [Syntrophaceae bacterium]